MLYFPIKADKVTAIAQDISQYQRENETWISRHDIRGMDHAGKIAYQASILTKKLHLPVDEGSNVWPRFDVIEAPRVGQPISYAFNGDYYPCGEIATISGAPLIRRITSTTGKVFWRRHQSAAWIYDGTWSMVSGHRSELNPSF